MTNEQLLNDLAARSRQLFDLPHNTGDYLLTPAQREAYCEAVGRGDLFSYSEVVGVYPLTDRLHMDQVVSKLGKVAEAFVRRMTHKSKTTFEQAVFMTQMFCVYRGGYFHREEQSSFRHLYDEFLVWAAGYIDDWNNNVSKKSVSIPDVPDYNNFIADVVYVNTIQESMMTLAQVSELPFDSKTSLYLAKSVATDMVKEVPANYITICKAIFATLNKLYAVDYYLVKGISPQGALELMAQKTSETGGGLRDMVSTYVHSKDTFDIIISTVQMSGRFAATAGIVEDTPVAMEDISISTMAEDVERMDDLAGYNVMQSIPEDMQDLAYLSMCIAGEAGEVANSCKKLIRDGFSEEEWDNLQRELIDVMIYIVKLAKNHDIDLAMFWDAKHAELFHRNDLGEVQEWYEIIADAREEKNNV